MTTKCDPSATRIRPYRPRARAPCHAMQRQIPNPFHGYILGLVTVVSGTQILNQKEINGSRGFREDQWWT